MIKAVLNNKLVLIALGIVAVFGWVKWSEYQAIQGVEYKQAAEAIKTHTEQSKAINKVLQEQHVVTAKTKEALKVAEQEAGANLDKPIPEWRRVLLNKTLNADLPEQAK